MPNKKFSVKGICHCALDNTNPSQLSVGIDFLNNLAVSSELVQ